MNSPSPSAQNHPRAGRFDSIERCVLGKWADAAIELGLGGLQSPEACVDAGLRLLRATNCDEFFGNLRPSREAELRARARFLVENVITTWPGLAPHPLRTEVPMRASLAGGAVILRGRPDLVAGDTAGKMLVLDHKSGSPRGTHRAEHMYYALLTTLHYGHAPVRAATNYLSLRQAAYDDVTIDLLLQVAHHVIAVAHALDRHDSRSARHPRRRRSAA